MKGLILALALRALLLLPQPPKQPMVRCGDCGTWNDPARGSGRCRNCQAWL